MINRKDLSALILILVVGTVVAIINPRFLSPINLSNTANLIGLFGIFAVAQAFVIISAVSSFRSVRSSPCSASSSSISWRWVHCTGALPPCSSSLAASSAWSTACWWRR